MLGRPFTHLFALLLLTTPLLACGDDDDRDNQEPSPSVEAPGTLIEGAMERDLNPNVDEVTFAEFSRGNRDFAFALMDELRKDDEANLFTSPFSVSVALAMTYGGARGQTKEQIQQTLRYLLDDDDLHRSFNQLDLELASRASANASGENEPFTLNVVNRVWSQEGADWEQDFLDLLGLHYGAGIYEVNFRHNPEPIRQGINSWVADQTNQLITDLLPEGSIHPDVLLVLVNAIYFYGSWRYPFSENGTRDRPFTHIDGTTTDVPMMRLREAKSMRVFESTETIAAALPYVGQGVTLVAMMPADDDADFLAWERDFSRQDFDDVIDGMQHLQAMIRFPRFEDRAVLDLSDTLKEMGMPDAFESADADFTGMLPTVAPLYIHDIFHEAFISIDEEGTEAAAATAVIVGTDNSAEEPFVEIEIDFDRPFLYAIYDHPTETILFMGRQVNPS